MVPAVSSKINLLKTPIQMDSLEQRVNEYELARTLACEGESVNAELALWRCVVG